MQCDQTARMFVNYFAFLMQMYAWNIPKSRQLFECRSSTFASPSNKEKEFNEIEQCELLQKFLVVTDGQWL